MLRRGISSSCLLIWPVALENRWVAVLFGVFLFAEGLLDCALDLQPGGWVGARVVGIEEGF